MANALELLLEELDLESGGKLLSNGRSKSKQDQAEVVKRALYTEQCNLKVRKALDRITSPLQREILLEQFFNHNQNKAVEDVSSTIGLSKDEIRELSQSGLRALYRSR